MLTLSQSNHSHKFIPITMSFATGVFQNTVQLCVCVSSAVRVCVGLGGGHVYLPITGLVCSSSKGLLMAGSLGISCCATADRLHRALGNILSTAPTHPQPAVHPGSAACRVGVES